MIKNTLALLFGTIIALLFLEGFLQVYNPFPFRVKGNKIFLQTNRKLTMDGAKLRGVDKHIVHTKNSLGFRGDEKPKDFDGYFSVVVVGGSTTECYYLSDNSTWPAQLEKRLRGRYNKVWVNNAGMDGHSTFGHIVLLEEFLLRLKPKMIIFLVGCNDRGRADLKDDKSNLYETLSWPQKLLKKSEVMSTIINIKRVILARNSGVMHGSLDLLKAQRMEIPDAEIRYEIERNKTTYFDGYRKRLAKLIALCRSNGIDPVFITQPSLLGVGRDDVTGIDLETIRVNDFRNGKLSWEVLKAYNEVTKTVADENRALVIDLGAEMPKSSRYYYDEFHFNNDGADKVAQIIYSRLRPYIDKNYSQYVRQ